MEQLGKFTLKKFLLLVLFLDCAKLTRLIDHDPCLFDKEASFKVCLQSTFENNIVTIEKDGKL